MVKASGRMRIPISRGEFESGSEFLTFLFGGGGGGRAWIILLIVCLPLARFQRLLDLSKTSDEQHYLASLARAGTPLERQGKGLTVTRASGTWLTSPSSGGGGGGGGHGSAAAGTVTAQRGNGEMMTMAEKKRTGRSSSTPSSKNAGGGGAGGGGKAIAEFRTEGGYEVTEEEGFKFE